MEVHLVDGTFELFRCFHGAPSARTSAGREVGAARALLATMVALLNEPSVTHVAVAFDAVVPPAGAEWRPKPAAEGDALELAGGADQASDAAIGEGPPVAAARAGSPETRRASEPPVGEPAPTALGIPPTPPGPRSEAALASPPTPAGPRSEAALASPPPPPRKRSEAALAAQVGLAADVVRALGVEVWPSGRYQADELLATAAARFAADARVERVVICTTDLDLAQCVRGERVVLLDRSRKRVTTELDVSTRFGVPPRLLADLFALVGDRSDGIAGVPGWGLRTAAALISAYGSVEAIPDDHAAWTPVVRGAARLAQSLRERRREAVVARDVLRLRDDVAFQADLEDLHWLGARRDAAESLAATIEYRDPLEWLSTWRG